MWCLVPVTLVSLSFRLMPLCIACYGSRLNRRNITVIRCRWTLCRDPGLVRAMSITWFLVSSCILFWYIGPSVPMVCSSADPFDLSRFTSIMTLFRVMLSW